MSKEVEIAMVHAADYALDYLEKNQGAIPDEIISSLIKSNKIKAKPEDKVLAIASVDEIIKLKKQNKHKTKKQLLQMFVNNKDEFLRRIDFSN